MVKKSYLIILLMAFVAIIVTLLSFLVSDFEKVKGDLKTYDEITQITKYSGRSGLFYTESEKSSYLDSLKYYEGVLDSYTKTTRSDIIGDEILKVKKLIGDQVLRIGRLNKLLTEPIEFNEKSEIKEIIHYQEPYTRELSTLSFIFSCKHELENISAIQVIVYRGESIVFHQQYKPEKVNSIVVPHIPESNEIIELGYIEEGTFKYINYNL